MARKKTDTTPVTSEATPTPRTPRVLTPAAQSLINEAKALSVTARNNMKEAKAIVKITDCIEKLSPWGIGKIKDVVAAREAAIAGQ